MKTQVAVQVMFTFIIWCNDVNQQPEQRDTDVEEVSLVKDAL